VPELWTLGALSAFLFMKLVFTSLDSLQVGLMQSILDSANIPCEVRNAAVSQVMIGAQFAPELWILRDEDYDEATQVISEFSRKSD
jgi:hypothetical protein